MGKSNLLYIQVKDYLKNLIKGMSPNEKLPSRSIICNELHVAKITVDRAISELIGEGYLYAQNGSGTYVAEPILSEPEGSELKAWGVVVPHAETFMFPQLINGISDVASKYGVNLILCDTNDDCRKEEMYIASLIRSDVDGVLIVPSSDENELRIKSYHSLTKAKIPFVFCNRDMRGVDAPAVKSNEYHGGYLATKHLLEHGYTSIGFLSQKRYSTVEQRFSGYAAALAEAGVSVNPDYIYITNHFDEKEAAIAGAAKILSAELKPRAIFCFNDFLAAFLFDELSKAGIHVPGDIALVSCDNTLLCDVVPSKLTSVDCSRYEIGYEAAMELVRITGLDPTLPHSVYSTGSMTVLPQKLVVRESCGCQITD